MGFRNLFSSIAGMWTASNTARGWEDLIPHKTQAGIGVNEEKALTLPAVFRAVDSLASHLAMLPLPVYRRLENGDRERATDHTAHGLLNSEPNPEQTAIAFRRAMHLHALLWGNGYAEVERGTRGRPRALWLRLPDAVTPRRHDTNGKLYYECRLTTGEPEIIPAADMIHIAGLSYDGVVGFGLIKQIARENIGLGLAIASYAQSFFGNNAILGTILSSPTVLKKEQKEANLAAWNAAHQGPDKAFRSIMMDGGLKAEKLAVDNDAAQVLEIMTFSVQDVARWLNVPPPMLMDLSRATFSNIVEQGMWYVKYSLAPWFKVYEQEFGRKLLTAAERKNHFVEYLAHGLMRGDDKARGEYYSLMLDRGVLTINEVRRLENLNGIGPAGDEHYVPLNMTTAERMAEGADSSDSKASPPRGEYAMIGGIGRGAV